MGARSRCSRRGADPLIQMARLVRYPCGRPAVDLGLSGKVSLVAAATSGLGRSTAMALGMEGCAVSICGRDRHKLADTEAELRQIGAPVLACRVDVTDESAVAAWVAQTVAEFGALHVVVTNGDGPVLGPVDTFALDEYRAALETTMLPHIGLVLAALPHLRAAGWGRILLVASETIRQPIPLYGLSSTVRPSLLGFARAMVSSLSGTEITVNVLAPGYHDTEGMRRQLDGDVNDGLAQLAAQVPLGRLGRAEDFGVAAAFLASEAASFITGTMLVIDGGATAFDRR